MNIIISGWPGAGSSTLSMILSNKLNYRLLRGSESFRYLGEKLGYSDLGKDRVLVDTMLENYWGAIYDKYIDYCILNRDNLVIESDIGAFRVDMGKTHISIFLAPSIEERKDRLINDGREKDVEELINREKQLQQSYLKLHNIDWLDLNEVKKHYDIIITNSKTSISQELDLVYELLFKKNSITPDQYKIFMDNSKLDEESYWSNGKKYYLSLIEKNNLLTTGAEVLKECIELFPLEISHMPRQLRSIIEDVT